MNQNRVNRLPVIAVLLLSLLLTGVTRQYAQSMRTARTGGSVQSLSRMNSFSLALLLGGLRGPLVMVLWQQSEQAKVDRDLEGVDTMIEWIRLLQPEFDTVHIFQIWNKAYNLSVQMASIPNKYLVILDALKYAKDVDAERPNNINILTAIGNIYFDKFGSSTEKRYYRERVRRESLPHVSLQRLSENDSAYRILDAKPVLSEEGNVLPNLLRPGTARYDDPSEPSMKYDGSDLQFLKQFEPYPYGVSPFAFAYNYNKRSQVLGRLAKQQHSQLSDLVVDSRPALSLKNWAEEEGERSRRYELEYFGKAIPEERANMETPTQDISPSTTVDGKDPRVLQAIYGYRRSVVITKAADDEYILHLSYDKFSANASTYESHRAGLAAQAAMYEADAYYLEALSLPPAERAPLFAKAKAAYWVSIGKTLDVAFLYFLPPDLLPQVMGRRDATRENFSPIPPANYDAVVDRLNLITTQFKQSLGDDIPEYLLYIARARNRIAQIDGIK